MTANEVKIKVTVDDAGVKSATDRVKAGMHDVETASDKAGNKVTEFGRRSASIKQDLASLDSGILKSKESLGLLASALANTDDAAQRIDIKKAMSKVQSDLSAASKAKKLKLSELLDLKPDPEAASSFMSKMGSQLSAPGPKLAGAVGNPIGLALGASIGVAAAPQIASAISGLVSAGAGLAVIGGGIALAVKNSPGIQQAGQDVGLKFMKAMGGAVKSYNGPILASIGILGDAATRVAGRLKSAFEATSSSIVPLVRDIVQGVEGVINAVTDIASDSGPALAGFGDMFRLVMDGVADGLKAMASDGESAGRTLVLLGGIIGDVIRKTGQFIGFLNKVSDLPGPLKDLKNHFMSVAEGSDDLRGSTSALADSMTNAEKAANGERDALAGLSSELRAQTDPVFGVIKAQGDLKKAQKETADATKKHGKNSDEAKEAMRKQAMAALDLEANVGKLGDSFNGKMTPALRATLKAAGLTDSAINGLEGQFRSAKKTGDAFSRKYVAAVKVENYRAAMDMLRGVKDTAMDIPRAVTIAMRITGVASVSKQAAAIRKAYAHGGITGAAAQGGMRTDKMTLVGESGPELLELPPSTKVNSAPDTNRLLGGIAAAAGGGSRPTDGGIPEQLRRLLPNLKPADRFVYPTPDKGKPGPGSNPNMPGSRVPVSGGTSPGSSSPGDYNISFTPTGQAVLDELLAWMIQHLQIECRTTYGRSAQVMFGGR